MDYSFGQRYNKVVQYLGLVNFFEVYDMFEHSSHHAGKHRMSLLCSKLVIKKP